MDKEEGAVMMGFALPSTRSILQDESTVLALGTCVMLA